MTGGTRSRDVLYAKNRARRIKEERDETQSNKSKRSLEYGCMREIVWKMKSNTE